MSSPTIKLNNGYEMPLVGFGLWKVNNDTCADQVYNAIKAGYRLLDGACGKYFLVFVYVRQYMGKIRYEERGGSFNKIVCINGFN